MYRHLKCQFQLNTYFIIEITRRSKQIRSAFQYKAQLPGTTVTHDFLLLTLKKPNLNPSVLANYCPISNLDNISKVIERLFLTHHLPHITSSPNINHIQSAYTCHNSTETSFIYLLDSIFHAADDELAKLLLSLDLSAAFDKIDHSINLQHLSTSFGVMRSAHN